MIGKGYDAFNLDRLRSIDTIICVVLDAIDIIHYVGLIKQCIQ